MKNSYITMQSLSALYSLILQECGITGRSYTYDDIRIKSTNLNRSLRKKFKLQTGDVIAICLPNIPEYFICVFAAFLANLTVTTLNPVYTSGKLA